MTISSRTPEGQPNGCPVCGKLPKVDPSTYPTRDAPCPHCGSLLMFSKPAPNTSEAAAEPESLWPWTPLPPRPAAPLPPLQVQEFADPQQIDEVEHLLERLKE